MRQRGSGRSARDARGRWRAAALYPPPNLDDSERELFLEANAASPRHFTASLCGAKCGRASMTRKDNPCFHNVARAAAASAVANIEGNDV